MGNMLGKSTSRETSELLKSIIERLFGSEGEYWAKVYNKAHRKENPFEGAVINPHQKEVRSWKKFYEKVFDESCDFSNVSIPKKPEGDWWLIIVAKGMKPQRIFDRCREKFGDAWKWTEEDLDKIITSDRTADKGHYAVWVRANVEADEQFKNLSANQLKELGHKGITPEERLLLELFYFWKTKKHLDIQNWTLCTGSRYSDGGVPIVSFHPYSGRVNVYYDGADNAYPHLRSREIVS